MAPAHRPELSVGPGQVRDYILSMLEGLSGLADSAGDADAGERLRQFAHGLIAAWSPGAMRPLADGAESPAGGPAGAGDAGG